MTIERVRVEADGGARGNPGPAGYGAVVREADTGEVLAERSDSLGVTTNNVAEYAGLIAGLAAAAELGARSVDVLMDSKLVVEQMSGRWKIKHPGLRPLAAEAAALVRRFDEVTFSWIPRERNKRADALANAAMDAAGGARAGARGRAPSAASGTRTSGGSGGTGSAASPDGDHPGAATAAAPAHARDTLPVGTAAEPAAEPAGGHGGAAGSWEPRTATPTRLILVRHGETVANAERRWSGRGDVPLSARGRAQATATARRVAALGPVTAVLTSPLTRCVRTAEAIGAALSVPVTVEPDLVECDFGDWEGRTFTEVRAGWPDELAAWLDSTAVAPPGGESMRTVAARVRATVRRLLDRYPRDTLVLVSHVTPIKLILRDALGAGDALLHRLHLDAGGVSTVDTWADGGVSVRTVNETGHLDT